MSKWTYVYLDGVKITSLDSNQEREEFSAKLSLLDESEINRVVLVNDWQGMHAPHENCLTYHKSHDVIRNKLIEKTPCHSKETISESDFFAAMSAAFSLS